MIPGIKAKPTYTLNIPKLSGGMNLRDGISLIQDNQLTDSKNMWYKDGMLRTRPRVRSNGDEASIIKSDSYSYLPGSFIYHTTVEINPDNVTVVNGKKYVLQVTTFYERSEAQQLYSQHVRLEYISENDANDHFLVKEFSTGTFGGWNMLTIQYNGDIYCYMIDEEYPYVCKIERIGERIYGDIKRLSYNDIYAPLIATNCLPGEEINGTMVEGYNLLGQFYRIIYSSVNPNQDTTVMEYKLLHDLSEEVYDELFRYEEIEVSVHITDINGREATHTVTLNGLGGAIEESYNESDRLKMEVDGKSVRFYEYNSQTSKDELKVLTKSEFVKNNLVITAPCPPNENGKLKVCGMTKSAWFGGAAYGIYGGSRLFLGGNTEEKEQALVIWSDLNNPLYFPENCYAYVGDKSQAVTAFGRQSDTLVIFKEREIYQTQYVSSDAPTAEEVINQSVIDLTTQMAYFPMTQVHGYIGCDCPNTVQLCRNRLVWANSNGKVYTLVSQNQYNERAVFCVSEMMERKLREEKNLYKAFSADFDGYYVLVVDDRMYVMDYNSYGYNYISSYSKDDDANVHIPWYYWELPVKPYAVAATTYTLLMPVSVEADYNGLGLYCAAVNMFYMDGSYGADEINLPVYEDYWTLQSEMRNIPSFVQTKLFDFGQPALLKSVPIVNFSFGYNDGLPINVQFISERQVPDGHIVTITGADAEKYSPEYMHTVRLFPYTKGTVRFGAKISCDGELLIDSMSLQYKALGGAK